MSSESDNRPFAPESVPPEKAGTSVVADSAEAATVPTAKPRSIPALMWRRFKRNRIAYVSLWGLGIFYVVAVFADFIAPYTPQERFSDFRFAPPSTIRIFEDGQLTRPYVRAWEDPYMDKESFRRVFKENPDARRNIRFFVRGEPYKLFKLIETDIHLFGTGDPKAPVFLFGADRFGRDLFSRVLYGSQVSLSVGLVGVFLTVFFGSMIGAISGYFGGFVDILIQRLIEILNSIPGLPLWLALAAIVPATWSSVSTYLMITVILSFIGWTGLGRDVRGLTLRLRQSDLVMAARCIDVPTGRILRKYLVPQRYSLIIVVASLSIPGMILGETALSFLGLGIRPPMVSWGVLLADAQNISNVAFYPWLLWPALFVVSTVLAFNFIGDGARDATDPFTY